MESKPGFQLLRRSRESYTVSMPIINQKTQTHHMNSSLKDSGARPLVNTQMLINVWPYLPLKSTYNNLLHVKCGVWMAPLLLPLGCFISCMWSKGNTMVFSAISYALLQRKTQTSYETMLRVLEEAGCDPFVVIVDFERTVELALHAVFGEHVNIQYCFYHLTQSIWRKIQSLGLTNLYESNDDFLLFCRQIFNSGPGTSHPYLLLPNGMCTRGPLRTKQGPTMYQKDGITNFRASLVKATQ